MALDHSAREDSLGYCKMPYGLYKGVLPRGRRPTTHTQIQKCSNTRFSNVATHQCKTFKFHLHLLGKWKQMIISLANISWHHHGFPAKWRLSSDCSNSILMARHYPDLESASAWSSGEKIGFNQSVALPRYGWCHVISMEFLRSFLRCHFAGKPVAASRNVGCFPLLP